MNKDSERELINMVREHDRLLRGNGDQDGLLHSVRGLVEAEKTRKRMQQAILVGVAGLLIERLLAMLRQVI